MKGYYNKLNNGGGSSNSFLECFPKKYIEGGGDVGIDVSVGRGGNARFSPSVVKC